MYKNKHTSEYVHMTRHGQTRAGTISLGDWRANFDNLLKTTSLTKKSHDMRL